MSATPVTSQASAMQRASTGGQGDAARRASPRVASFCLNFGMLVPIAVYLSLLHLGADSAATLGRALTAAFLSALLYNAFAYAVGEWKYFDGALLVLFAIGAVAQWAQLSPLLQLFRTYSGALLFLAFAAAAALPPLLGLEPFTDHFARRMMPRWRLLVPEFAAVSRFMAAYWTALFLIAAGLSALHPASIWFTLVLPNLVIFGLGVMLTDALPDLYARVFPPPLPALLEPLIMTMPRRFSPPAAAGAAGVVQLQVEDGEPSAYFLEVANGRCRAEIGVHPAPDLTIAAEEATWVAVGHGELTTAQALAQERCRARGDLELLAKLASWFPNDTARLRRSPAA